MKQSDAILTKDDSRALWHAVESLRYMVRAMNGHDYTDEQRAAERSMLLAARRALRKVNAIRKAQSSRSTAKLQVQQAEQARAAREHRMNTP